jgi:hypothetical protein
MNDPMKHRLIAASLSIFAALAPGMAAAQTNGFQFNIAAGAAFPTGDFGRFTDVGYNLTVGIGTRQRASSLGFRAEGTYSEWSVSGLSNAKTHAGGVTGNVTLDLTNATSTAGTGNSFYLIGGAGMFDTGNDWHPGLNIGGGFRFPLTGFSAYLEARYHAVSDANVKFVPVVFGLVF